MDRRKSLKLIATGAVAVPAVIAGCTTTDKKVAEPEKAEASFTLDRNPDELKYERELLAKEKIKVKDDMVVDFEKIFWDPAKELQI